MNMLIIGNPIFTLSESELAQIKTIVPGVEISYPAAADVTDDHLRNADVIFGWPDPSRLSIARNLKWLHTPSAGIDAYANRSIYANEGVIVTRSKDVFNIQIAEHIIMLFLALSRGLIACVKSTFDGKWARVGGQLELSGATVLVVGAGAIGSELAGQLKGFGCKVIGIRRTASELPPYCDESYGVDMLDAVLPRADYVALCLPRTPETKGMFDYRRFSLMKRTAIITNIGRGDAIVSDDIDRALRESLIFGAGLDVTEPEPLPEDHPLWSAPNTIITSHTSGTSANADMRRFAVFTDLLGRFAAGQPMHSLVDFDKGY
ncbi:MAG: D-2-hydroxyacid dehydrogenase [Oscillospiraceae bacterium]|nr:D-2-hydroxyacid dehydrogenase [Oscillospiraceae bacterium]